MNRTLGDSGNGWYLSRDPNDVGSITVPLGNVVFEALHGAYVTQELIPVQIGAVRYMAIITALSVDAFGDSEVTATVDYRLVRDGDGNLMLVEAA